MNVTDEQVATALKAAIDLQLVTLIRPTKALEADEHPAANPEHVQFALQRRPGAPQRLGRESRQSYRILTRPVAKTVSNVRALNRRLALALLGAEVPVGSLLTSPIEREIQDPPTPDDGMFSARAEWTFTV